MNPVRQITNYLNSKGYNPEYDKDSFTLFLEHDTTYGTIQTRYYFDIDMNILSCQAIYTEELNKDNYNNLCVLCNVLNEIIGVGTFIILEKESVVFEINQLINPEVSLSEDILDKLSFIPSEALTDHLDYFIDLSENKATIDEIIESL